MHVFKEFRAKGLTTRKFNLIHSLYKKIYRGNRHVRYKDQPIAHLYTYNYSTTNKDIFKNYIPPGFKETNASWTRDVKGRQSCLCI